MEEEEEEEEEEEASRAGASEKKASATCIKIPPAVISRMCRFYPTFKKPHQTQNIEGKKKVNIHPFNM